MLIRGVFRYKEKGFLSLSYDWIDGDFDDFTLMQMDLTIFSFYSRLLILWLPLLSNRAQEAKSSMDERTVNIWLADHRLDK